MNDNKTYKPKYLDSIKRYVSSYVDSALYSLGDLLVKFNLTTTRLVVIILFVVSILLFLGIGFSFAISEWFALPTYAGFFIMAACLAALLVVILFLLRGKKDKLGNFFANIILNGIEQIRSSIHDINDSKVISIENKPKEEEKK